MSREKKIGKILKQCSCGNSFKVFPYRIKTGKFCSVSCGLRQRKGIPTGRSRKGEVHKRWKGGRVRATHGYIILRMPEHPKNQNGYVLEHRFVMEKKLGRQLTFNEMVHHKNGVKDDNRPENLQVVLRTTHKGEVSCPKCLYEFAIK